MSDDEENYFSEEEEGEEPEEEENGDETEEDVLDEAPIPVTVRTRNPPTATAKAKAPSPKKKSPPKKKNSPPRATAKATAKATSAAAAAASSSSSSRPARLSPPRRNSPPRSSSKAKAKAAQEEREAEAEVPTEPFEPEQLPDAPFNASEAIKELFRFPLDVQLASAGRPGTDTQYFDVFLGEEDAIQFFANSNLPITKGKSFTVYVTRKATATGGSAATWDGRLKSAVHSFGDDLAKIFNSYHTNAPAIVQKVIERCKCRLNDGEAAASIFASVPADSDAEYRTNITYAITKGNRSTSHVLVSVRGPKAGHELPTPIVLVGDGGRAGKGLVRQVAALGYLLKVADTKIEQRQDRERYKAQREAIIGIMNGGLSCDAIANAAATCSAREKVVLNANGGSMAGLISKMVSTGYYPNTENAVAYLSDLYGSNEAFKNVTAIHAAMYVPPVSYSTVSQQ